MPDEKKPPEQGKQPEQHEPAAEEEAGRAETDKEMREAHGEMARVIAEGDLEQLAGACFDMGAALRDKVKAITAGDLRKDILAAHAFNEAARQFRSLLPVVDRSHKLFLEANPDVE